MTNDLILVIDHRETLVRMDGRALRIDRPDAPPEHVPLGLIGLVVVHGSPLVGCEVWRELAERNIPAVLQPGRGRGRSALIGAALGGTIELRAAQHRAGGDAGAALAIACRLVAGKIEAQARLLERLDQSGASARTLRQLQAASLDQVDTAASNAALMGVEGAAAAAWYAWLGAWLPERWRFHGRNRRPPRDPVNSLLSLGYTLLGGEVLHAVQDQGLDPALGFLHGIVPGRESLVLDLMEPLRPSVDCLVLGMLDEVLLPTHFTHSARDGCRLNKAGRSLFYREWAIARSDWPDLLGIGKPPAASPAESGEADDRRYSLSALCRQQVERLRVALRPFLPKVSTDG
jgi:CRISPR-associated protein Cas1